MASTSSPHNATRRSKAKNWCFTWNNYPENYASYFPIQDASYTVFGLEVGESGTKHLQGYIQFKRQRLFSTVRRLFDGSAHWEVQRGSAKQASDYCKKDGEYTETGILSLSANDRRSSIADDCRDIVQRFESGETTESIIRAYPHRTKNIRDLSFVRPARTSAPRVLYLHSGTGRGKTTNTMAAIRELGYTLYVKPSGVKWWPGYDGQRVVVLEEFQSCFTVSSFLQLCDASPFQVEFKGGFTQFNSEFVIILTNLHPDDQYSKVKEERNISWEAYRRRVRNSHCVNNLDYDQIKTLVKEFLL